MIIGLTGGIGSGKTIIAKLFETMGCVIYNSDESAKALYFDQTIKQQISLLLGEHAYLNPNTINKEYIANLIFSDPILLRKINAIIHPAVKKDFEIFKNKFTSDKIIIKETALLFETGNHKELDYSVLVTSPLEIKIKRIKNRNNFKREEILKRINTQWLDEKKIPLSNFVIINDNIEPLIPQVILIIKKLKQNA